MARNFQGPPNCNPLFFTLPKTEFFNYDAVPSNLAKYRINEENSFEEKENFFWKIDELNKKKKNKRLKGMGQFQLSHPQYSFFLLKKKKNVYLDLYRIQVSRKFLRFTAKRRKKKTKIQ